MSETLRAVACAVLSALSLRGCNLGGTTEATTIMRPLHDCRLYGIIDLGYVHRGDAGHIAEQMIEGGVDVIQLRGKNNSIDELVDIAAELHDLAAKSSTPVIVNDHAEIAARVPVEGV